MIAAYRAELVKLLRRRVLVITAVATAVFAIGSAAVLLTSADPAGRPVEGRGVTVATLSEAGGGTQVFVTSVSFAGSLLFVLFVGAVAVEFSRGTFRTMLLHQPRRVRLLAGKMAALIAFAAAVLAAIETLTWVAARLIAPSQGVATANWLSVTGFGDGLLDFGSALFWVSGYALLAMAVAVLVRSVPVALAVGIAWIGPIEHILQDRWGPASRVFPGLLLEAFVAGGTSAVSADRALVTIAVYVAVAAAVGAAVFARRDITA